MSYYRRKEYTYNGGDKFFTITFPYIKKEHIEVYVNGTKTTNFSFNTSTQIVVNDNLVNGDKVLLKSNTPIDSKMVTFTDTSILKKDVQNLAQNQMFYALQENNDNNDEFTAQINSTISENQATVTEEINTFKTQINSTISEVNQAAQTIETTIATVNGAVTTCTAKADIAVEKATEVVNAATTLTNTVEEVTANTNAIGTLGNLNTTNKDNLVNAINEVRDKAIDYSTNAEALAGTDDASIMTPLKVKTLIDYCNKVLENTKAARKDFLIAGSTHSSVKICAGTLIKCTLSSKEYKLKQTEDYEFDVISKLDTGTALTAGKDYSIYLVENAATTSGLDFKVSLNGTYPTGYSATTAYKIGGFHTECVSVTSANAPALTSNTYWTTHPAIGYNAGDIIPISIWTLLHRPISDPNGMVYINILNMWADIYLQSGTGSLTKSVFGGTTTDTRTQIQHQMDLALVGKRPMTDYEFMVAAEGSNQRTNISGSADPVTTGGHLDTANKRMTSGWFLEDCCGALWQWLVTALGGASASAWAEYPDTARGQYYWNTYYFLAGGFWGDGASCGSWSRFGGNVRSIVDAGIGCRGVSLPLFN